MLDSFRSETTARASSIMRKRDHTKKLSPVVCWLRFRHWKAVPSWFSVSLWAVLLSCTPAHTAPELVGEAAPLLRGSGPRLALLVGISRYPQSAPPGIRPWRLLHAHRDVLELRRVLTNRYGFLDSDILTLEDQAATADRVRTAFRSRLLEHARPGAVIVFHFSGHGQQVRDDNNDELDGRDETLVPADAIDQRESSGARVNLRDDEIGIWLTELQARMRDSSGQVQGSINVFLDTCHSGTATRGDLIERGRGWDVELDGPVPIGADSVGERAHSFADLEGDYVLLSAARSDQTAKELSDGSGAFTSALVGALWRATAHTTYRGLRDEVLSQVQADVWNQSPQLEGKPDQLLFGGTAPPPQPYVLVETGQGRELTLAAGALHLVTEGSIYSLYRAGSEPMDQTTRLGDAEVIRTTAERSTLRLLPDPAGRLLTAANLRAARAVERVRSYKDRQLRLLVADRSIPRDVLKRVHALPLVTEKGVRANSYDVKLTQAHGYLELRRPESGCPVARVPLAGRPLEGVTSSLISRLEGMWRWRQLQGLRHSGLPMRATLRLVPVKGQLGAAGYVESEPSPRTDLAPSAELRLREDELFMLELENPTPQPLWVTVLGVDPAGDTQVLFPKATQPGDGLLQPGLTRLSSQYVFQTQRPLGLLIFKVISTQDPVDLSGLVNQSAELGHGAQPWVERGARLAELMTRAQKFSARVGPLAQLLLHAFAGSHRARELGLPLVSWGVSQAQIEVAAAGVSGRTNEGCTW